MLGVWAGEQLVSPVADEVKLQRLVGLLDRMFDHCNETVAATLHLLRCWLHTATREGFWLKPTVYHSCAAQRPLPLPPHGPPDR
jgi:hypothetical protein